ncbi:MAG: GAP family protein [Bacteroidota bacterium]|nr:GAP family protein [Bacteroidota bacterium]
MNTIFYSFSLSLFDSLSTTQQIIIFMLLLTTAKPLQNALSYLAGLSGAYFACGMVGYMTLDRLRIFLSKFFPSTDALSNQLYYRSEFILGLIMAVIGIWYFYRKKQGRPDRTENMILLRLRTMNSLFAFWTGVIISVTSFPVSIPYLVALGNYAALHAALPVATGYILLYNIGYALPMIVVFFLYLFARGGMDDLNDTMHDKANKLNVHLTTWTFIGFGLFSMVDAGCYFTIGHALIKGRYF